MGEGSRSRYALRQGMSWVGLGLRVTALALIASAAEPSAAAAQERDGVLWLTGAHGQAVGPTRTLNRALARSRPDQVMDPALARLRFEQRGSMPPMLATHSDLDALARDAQQALYHVASGLTSQARRDVERALSRANRVLESLNRESLAAQHLLDACLYLVRAHLQSRQRDRARDQALECKRLVPDIEPDGTMHPPDVIGMLAEAEASLKLRTPGSLRVESEPPGCAVYVNGRRLGTAPLELPQLSPGEYRVQAECAEGKLGRVHRVQVQDDRSVARIDTRFDDAVGTQVELALTYPDWSALETHALPDAVEVGRVVGAREVYLVLPATSEPEDAVFQVHRIRVSDSKLLGAVRLHAAKGVPQIAEAAPAVAALNAGQFVALDGRATGVAPTQPGAAVLPTPQELAGLGMIAPPREIEAVETLVPDAATEASAPAHSQAAADSGPRARSGRSPVGWVLGITGIAASLVSVGLYGHLLALEGDYHDAQAAQGDAALEAVEAFQLVPLGVALSGAVLTTASLPWLLEPRERLPAWSIVLGAVGLGAAAVGTGLSIAGAQCDEFDAAGRCTDTLTTSRFGAMLLTWSVPLIGVPVVHILRGPGSRSDTKAISVGLAPGGLGLSLRGRL